MAIDDSEIALADLVVPEGNDPLLKSIRIPQGWSATVLAEFPGGNPSCLKATPEGALFLSVREDPVPDREKGRGRILKLMGKNWGGKANEIHEFVPELDSPQGLEWDGQWLYVMNPPNLIAVRDTNGDQVADETRLLISEISPGDAHGITLGIDGWLYLAIGESGLANAEGSDGTSLQLRGGGILRVRPDGSGLHVFSRGTREIRDVAVSPTLDVFARGSSHETIGWQSRLHHFTGLDHHGYPTLFRNFDEDVAPPVAEYENGVGAGVLFLAEPDLPPEYTNMLLTADPGRNEIFRREIEPAGATWRKVAEHSFVTAPSPTDVDVDVERRLYVAGRQNGNGFVIMVEPPNPPGKWTPPSPAPVDKGLPTTPLIQYLQQGAKSRLHVQRALLRRDLTNSDLDALEKLAADPSASPETRIAALFTMKLGFGEKANVKVAGLAADAGPLPFALRALGDFPDQKANLPPALFSKALSSDDPCTQREAILAVSRLQLTDLVPDLARLTTSDDQLISQLSINALTELKAIDSCFEILDDFDNYELWPGVFRALARIHEMNVVNGIISRLEKTDSSLFVAGALETLARLYHREGDWDGESQGPFLDTRGPYFDPVTWEGSAPIDLVLRKALRDKRVNKTFLFSELGRNRIPFDDFRTLLSITAVTPQLEEPTVSLILQKKEPPPDSLPFLTFIATSEDRPGDLRLSAAIALARAPDDMAATSAFRLTLEREEIDGVPRQREALKEALLKNAYHENRYDWLLEEAHGQADEPGILAWTILLQLTQLADLAPGARHEIDAALERVPSNPGILRRLLVAIADLEFSPDKKLVIDALDHPDESVSAAARKAAIILKLDPETENPAESR